jgi:hypothetical protein
VRLTAYHRTDDPALSALVEGARAIGHTARITPGKYWKPGEVDDRADAVLVVGLHGSARHLRDLYASRGVPVWVMDLPRLRGAGYAAGFTPHDLHALPAVGRTTMPPTPGILAGRTSERVLVIGQMPHDAAHGMDHAECMAWARETVALLRARTALPIHYRPHPLAPHVSESGADAIDRAPTIRDAMQTAAAVVTFNSTVGWDAIDAGVPVIATGPREMVGYAEYVQHGIPETLDGLRPCPAPKRRDALKRVAATCWTLDELTDGTAARAMFGEAPVFAEAA